MQTFAEVQAATSAAYRTLGDFRVGGGVFFFFFIVRHSFTIEDLVSAPNLKLGCAVILRGCASDYK